MNDLSTPQARAIELQCRQIIDGHAHRPILRDSDIRYWVREVVKMHGEMAVWHAARAGGFGGSEIGVLVRNHQGQRADHQSSAREIVLGKLLRILPDQDNGHLRRGNGNEDRHGQWFREKYAAVRDEEAFNKLKTSAGPRPWMRYSPDEVVLIPAEGPNPSLDGRHLVRVLGDYKAPSRVDETTDEISFQYACQLHQGAIICAYNGIHLDMLMLSQFDWAGWRLKDDVIPYDPELARQIMAAGDAYWDCVMRAEVPPYITRPIFEGEAKLREEWLEKSNRLAQMLALKKALETEIESIQVPMKEDLAKMRMSGTRMTIGELSFNTVSKVDHEKVEEEVAKVAEQSYETTVKALLKKGASPSYDADAMARTLKSMGVPLKQFAKHKYDDAKVYEFAKAHGLDPDAFATEEIRMSPSDALRSEAEKFIRATYGVSAQEQEQEQEQEQAEENVTAEGAVADSSDPCEQPGAAAAATGAEEPGRAGTEPERRVPRPVYA